MTTAKASPHKKPIHGRGFTLPPRRTPFVMGVLNVTPDSFSDGGAYNDIEAACAHAERMAKDGADIIDIGGESTRPGADAVSPADELERVLPVIERLSHRLDTPISIDTRRATVASAALEAGARIVNDVSACRDPEMPAVAREYEAPIIVMHMKGDPKSMQRKPTYEDVVGEVKAFLAARVEFLTSQGMGAESIVVDPGIGFGKRFRDNLELLGAMETFRDIGCPVMVGASRKTFLGEMLQAPPGERLAGNLAVAARCHAAGVDMIRVHDVKETVGLLRVLDAMETPTEYSADW
jgi:dihydropteroate synthase